MSTLANVLYTWSRCSTVQDVVNDVEGAQKMGMRGILVQTGMARTPTLERLS